MRLKTLCKVEISYTTLFLIFYCLVCNCLMSMLCVCFYSVYRLYASITRGGSISKWKPCLCVRQRNLYRHGKKLNLRTICSDESSWYVDVWTGPQLHPLRVVSYSHFSEICSWIIWKSFQKSEITDIFLFLTPRQLFTQKKRSSWDPA